MEQFSHKNQTFLIFHPNELVPVEIDRKAPGKNERTSFLIYDKNKKLVGSCLSMVAVKAVARLLGD